MITLSGILYLRYPSSTPIIINILYSINKPHAPKYGIHKPINPRI